MSNAHNLIGKGFESRPENINRAGRPKKIYTILKEHGFSKDDARDMFNEMGWHTESELKAMYESEQTPAIMKVVAHAYNKAMTKGDFRYISEIVQQAIGRPKEEQDVTLTAVYDITLNLDSENIQPTINANQLHEAIPNGLSKEYIKQSGEIHSNGSIN